MDYTISRIIFSGVEIISILFNKFKYNLGTKKKNHNIIKQIYNDNIGTCTYIH